MLLNRYITKWNGATVYCMLLLVTRIHTIRCFFSNPYNSILFLSETGCWLGGSQAKYQSVPSVAAINHFEFIMNDKYHYQYR